MNSFHFLRGMVLHHCGWWIGTKIKNSDLVSNAENYLTQNFGNDSLIEALTDGSNPIVRKITTGGNSSLVARAYYRGASREKSKEHSSVSILLKNNNIPVPEIIKLDDTYQTLGRNGFDVITEDWVAGRHPSPKDYQQQDSIWLERLMGLLASLHEIKSELPGKPWSRTKNNNDFLDYYFRSNEQPMIDIINQCDFISSSSDQIHELSKFLKSNHELIDPGKPYSLVHGDFQIYNMMLDESENKIWLLDYDTVHFGLWPLDFVRVWRDATKNNLQAMLKALGFYFEKRPAADKDYFRQAFPYMLVFYSLCKCGIAIRKCSRLERDAEGFKFQKAKALQHWAWIQEAITEPIPFLSSVETEK